MDYLIDIDVLWSHAIAKSSCICNMIEVQYEWDHLCTRRNGDK